MNVNKIKMKTENQDFTTILLSQSQLSYKYGMLS